MAEGTWKVCSLDNPMWFNDENDLITIGNPKNLRGAIFTYYFYPDTKEIYKKEFWYEAGEPKTLWYKLEC